MQLTERVFVKENPAMAKLCRAQTLVYNAALFLIRQEYIYLHDFNRKKMKIDATHFIIDIDKQIIEKCERPEVKFEIDEPLIVAGYNISEKPSEIGFLNVDDLRSKQMLQLKQFYREAIPGCAQETIRRCLSTWKGYFNAMKEWRADPSKFTGKPKIPDYTRNPDIYYDDTCRGKPFGVLDMERGEIEHKREPEMPRYASAKSPVYFNYTSFSIKEHRVHFPDAAGFDVVEFPRLNDQKIGDSNAPVKQVRVIPAKNGGYWIEAVRNVATPSLRDKIQAIIDENPSLPARTVESLKRELNRIRKHEQSEESKKKKRGKRKNAKDNGN